MRDRYGRILHRVMNELSVRDRERAVRILEWIACSFRIMKVYEIQDGIVLTSDNDELNEESKLTAGFLEICKPLIEEGQKNTVDFVHYSAKE